MFSHSLCLAAQVTVRRRRRVLCISRDHHDLHAPTLPVRQESLIPSQRVEHRREPREYQVRLLFPH